MRGLTVALLMACRGASSTFDSTVPVNVVARVPTFTEGIVFDEEGNGYFSELWSEHIWRWRAGEAPHRWARVPNPNGHRILPDGRHVVASFGANAIIELDSVGATLRAIGATDAGPLRDPNDLYPDSHGGIYFTDSVDSVGTINYLHTDGRAATLVRGLRYPNGIVVRPDNATVLVSEFLTGRILAFPVTAPGQLGPMSVFATMPPPVKQDFSFVGPGGMALDEAGNLYVAYFGAGEVLVFDSSGGPGTATRLGARRPATSPSGDHTAICSSSRVRKATRIRHEACSSDSTCAG